MGVFHIFKIVQMVPNRAKHIMSGIVEVIDRIERFHAKLLRAKKEDT